MNIKHKFIRTDVLSVKYMTVFEDPSYLLLFAAMGSNLFIFDIRNKCQVEKIRISDNNSIQTVQVTKCKLNASTVIVSLACRNRMTVLKLQFFNEINTPLRIEILNRQDIELKDWIMSSVTFENLDKNAVLLMCNEVLVFDTFYNIIRSFQCIQKCIIFSGFIAHQSSHNKLIILSGTAAHGILIWSTSNAFQNCDDTIEICDVIMELTAHKGYILSIDYGIFNGTAYICSTSDDRSTIVWSVNDLFTSLNRHGLMQQRIRVYGHRSKVFRCKLFSNNDTVMFLTGGEDSFVNVWNLNGNLLRSIQASFGACIWSMDYYQSEDNFGISNEEGFDKYLAIGDGAGGITLHAISPIKPHYISVENNATLKHIACLNADKIVYLMDNGSFYMYDINEMTCTLIGKHPDLAKYALLEVSKCRNVCALAGYTGQMYIYQNSGESSMLLISHQSDSSQSRIFAFHWLSCKSFLICLRNGILQLYSRCGSVIRIVHTFIMGDNRVSTTICQISAGFGFLVGDQNSNIHLFKIGRLRSIQTVLKAHDHNGITQILPDDSNDGRYYISLGRNSALRLWLLNNDHLSPISSDKLPFSWLASCHHMHYIVGFNGKQMVVWDRPNRRFLMQHDCGGGHRSWDFYHSSNGSCAIYVKMNKICYLPLDLNDTEKPLKILESFHAKVINCVRVISCKEDRCLWVSGGEDTFFRIVLVGKRTEWLPIATLKSHLSSIRTIAWLPIDEDDSVLVFSGGGRSQIICWKIHLGNANQCIEMDSYYEPLEQNQVETRIMHMEVVRVLQNFNKDNIYLWSSYNDGTLKVFHLTLAYKLQLLANIQVRKQHMCITKISVLTLGINRDLILLAIMTIDGVVDLVNITDVSSEPQQLSTTITFRCHQSGINSYCWYLFNDSFLVLLTGGDDNAIVITLLKCFKDSVGHLKLINVIDQCVNFSEHCAQISGIFICDKYFITASKDQRLVLFQWTVLNNKIEYRKLMQKCFSIGDLQGMEFISRTANELEFLLYGCGVEIVAVSVDNDIEI